MYRKNNLFYYFFFVKTKIVYSIFMYIRFCLFLNYYIHILRALV